MGDQRIHLQIFWKELFKPELQNNAMLISRTPETKNFGPRLPWPAGVKKSRLGCNLSAVRSLGMNAARDPIKRGRTRVWLFASMKDISEFGQ